MKIPGHRIRQTALALLTSFLMVLPVTSYAAPSTDSDPSALRMTGDLVVARPAMLAATLIGATVFVLSLPFSAWGGNAEQAAQTLVVEPAKNTFFRCLGCIERIPDSQLNF